MLGIVLETFHFALAQLFKGRGSGEHEDSAHHVDKKVQHAANLCTQIGIQGSKSQFFLFFYSK